jgi:hypothetical protein
MSFIAVVKRFLKMTVFLAYRKGTIFSSHKSSCHKSASLLKALLSILNIPAFPESVRFRTLKVRFQYSLIAVILLQGFLIERSGKIQLIVWVKKTLETTITLEPILIWFLKMDRISARNIILGPQDLINNIRHRND